ncbi:hypothetical protein M1403_00575 [Patescibacteria group bacterium]|nr:hypothetical protein [Patescibacteria group bacterium]
MDNSNNQKLIIEFEGPEDKIQELLERLEKEADESDDLEIKAVTIRKD